MSGLHNKEETKQCHQINIAPKKLKLPFKGSFEDWFWSFIPATKVILKGNPKKYLLRTHGATSEVACSTSNTVQALWKFLTPNTKKKMKLNLYNYNPGFNVGTRK